MGIKATKEDINEALDFLLEVEDQGLEVALQHLREMDKGIEIKIKLTSWFL